MPTPSTASGSCAASPFGPARLGESFATTTVREFTLEDVHRFLTNWHRLVAIGQIGAAESAEGYAAEQPRQLMAAIEDNERIRDLAINPLMLKVIAMVHRDRVKLPDRRAELYAEAVDVLLRAAR
jgi:predicted NACHT family NTPase